MSASPAERTGRRADQPNHQLGEAVAGHPPALSAPKRRGRSGRRGKKLMWPVWPPFGAWPPVPHIRFCPLISCAGLRGRHGLRQRAGRTDGPCLVFCRCLDQSPLSADFFCSGTAKQRSRGGSAPVRASPRGGSRSRPARKPIAPVCQVTRSPVTYQYVTMKAKPAGGSFFFCRDRQGRKSPAEAKKKRGVLPPKGQKTTNSTKYSLFSICEGFSTVLYRGCLFICFWLQTNRNVLLSPY